MRLGALLIAAAAGCSGKEIVNPTGDGHAGGAAGGPAAGGGGAGGAAGAGPAGRKRSAPVDADPDEGAFAAKLAIWVTLVDEAIAARTAAAARRAYEKADALDHLPIDLYNEDDVDVDALQRAHKAMNRKLDARIQALPALSKVAHELCGLRDMINTT